MSDPSQDPFFDPFSPEPVSPAPPWGPPTSPSAAPPPSAAPRPPAAQKVAGFSPATVFFGSYVFAGIAALLLATAIAVLIAISDLRSRGSTSGPMMVAAAAGLIVVAALVVSLGVLDDRGRSWARLVTWGVCGVGLCAGIAVFVLDPGESVAWFGQLLHVGAVATMIIAVASAILLALPESNAYFHPGRRAKPVASTAFPQPSAFSASPAPYQPPASPQPSASSAPPPGFPANDSDYDPFS
ncbi:hypothetical protein H7J83_09775 [Mycobacterium mantenii]|nr:hypothetical protein [Mycobacterium mantenii]MCV7243030.1 hypothetical protein [Mycobacterium mantenii]